MAKRLTKPSHILDELDYNTQRAPIITGEYGRIFQETIEKIVIETDREKRTKMAHALVNSMSMLNSHSRDSYEYKQKLWDHMHIVSGFKLEVDAPYPAPVPAAIQAKPERIPYNTRNIRYRYYGKIVEHYLTKVSTVPDSPEKNEYIRLLGSFLKSSCKSWNDENVSDQAIIDQMNELSDEQLNLAYDGQQFSIDMSRSGKSVNPLRGEDQKHRFNRNKRNNNRNKNRNKNK